LPQQRFDVIGKTGARELARREIDAHTQRLARRIIKAPFLDLPANFRQALVANRQNHSTLFRERDEFHWGHKPAFRMVPADQRL
jgi:hypothetical protein